MEDIVVNKPVKTYSNEHKRLSKTPESSTKTVIPSITITREPLSTKKAVELLLNGSLRSSVCRFCLHITYPLSELDFILNVAGSGAIYKVTIRDVVASVHPFKVVDDPNFPNKICEKCLTQATRAYLFAQQCEQAERALRNCFDDMFNKLEKLDPVERVKRRGRQKLNPNTNILYAEHRKVLDYAEPIRNLINIGSVSYTDETPMSELECKKCWQVLSDLESLVNHEKIHPSTMWYHCRTCGKGFAKRHHINKHLKEHLKLQQVEYDEKFKCNQCNHVTDDLNVHLQHIEKHKFHTVLEHLVERNMEKLCAVCLDKKDKMIDMDNLVCLHGGYPELTGDMSLYNVLGASVPEMNLIHNYTGHKICEKCLDYAIISYIFINRTHYIRSRLNICITKMLENLEKIEPTGKIIIEVPTNTIMPITEGFDENLLLDDNEIDEEKLKVDVLEDEFRISSSSEESDHELSETDMDNVSGLKSELREHAESKIRPHTGPNADKLANGFNVSSCNNIDVCSEFLTFKKKNATRRSVTKFTCPICNKHFISEYFLGKHAKKHINNGIECNICSSKFTSKFNLSEHVKMVHILKQNCHDCTFCGRMFKSEKRKLSHQKCHGEKSCELCSKVFASQKHYGVHLQRHAMRYITVKRKSEHSCSFCSKAYSNQNRLSIHVNKLHLQLKPYGCDMCERRFYTNSNLRHHKKIHSLFSEEKCELCNKTLKCRKDLVVHVRKHVGSKPYHCFLCSQTFYSEFQVKTHMSSHGGRFCCRLCKKIFVDKDGLKTHVKHEHSVF